MSTACISLSKSIAPDCAALKRPGGVGARVWLGSVLDVLSLTFGATNTHDLEAIAMKVTKKMVAVTGRRAKNSGGAAFEDGANITLRNQTLSLLVYAKTAADKQAVDEIVSQDQMFAVLERNDGQFEVFGINTKNYASWGMKVTGGSYSTGVEVNDETAYTLELTGAFENVPLVFDETETYANNLAALNALLVAAT